MSKVLLVQNAYHYQHHTHLQPLGLMYVASALRQKGHEVGLLDMKVEQMSMDAALDHVGRFRPDVLGVSGMSFESASMYEMAKRAKASWPEMTIVAGGPHATNVPEDALKQVPELDYICLGEGEQTSVEMMDQLTNGRPMDKVNGLAFMADGRFHQTPARDFIEDLDAVPFPAWDLVPLKKYFKLDRGGIIYARPEFMTVMTSRACPWKCTFCHNNMGKGYRPRSAENVVDELEALYRDVGIREIIFMDDMFNLHRERVRDICRGILSRGLDLKLTFPNGLRADIMDIETVKLLKEAGMYRCMYAIETGSPRLQKRIKKNVKLEKAKAIIAETAKLGVLTHGAFMLGFPTETEEEMQMTVDFACSTKLHTAAFYRVLPLPGSEIYSDVVSAGADVSGEIFDSPSQFEYHSSNVNLSTVDERFLTKIRKKAYLRFYLNPLRLPRLLWHLPNKLVMIPKLAKLFFLRAVQK